MPKGMHKMPNGKMMSDKEMKKHSKKKKMMKGKESGHNYAGGGKTEFV